MNDSYLILIVNVIQLACFFYTKPGVPIRGVFFYYTKFKIKKPPIKVATVPMKRENWYYFENILRTFIYLSLHSK